MKNIWIVFLFLIFSFSGMGQSSLIENLVFEGAGIRGIAYGGVLRVLEEKDMSQSIQKVGGTSAGAITALLFSLGYSSVEIESIISKTKFQKFNDGQFFFIGGISRTKKRFGWYRGRKFSKWIGALIQAKTGNSEITFEEFSNHGYKDVYFTATCLNQQRLMILSHETYPQMKLKDAVRISMSIPLYYQAVFVDSIGHTFNKQNKENNLDVMVDGGIIGNFPIQMFDTIIQGIDGRSSRIPNPHTLGIRIDSEEQIKADVRSRQLIPQHIEGFKDYMTAFYIMVIENLNRNFLTEDDWKRTVSISSAGISPKVKRLTEEQKKRLVESGRIGMEHWVRH